MKPHFQFGRQNHFQLQSCLSTLYIWSAYQKNNIINLHFYESSYTICFVLDVRQFLTVLFIYLFFFHQTVDTPDCNHLVNDETLYNLMGACSSKKLHL